MEAKLIEWAHVEPVVYKPVDFRIPLKGERYIAKTGHVEKAEDNLSNRARKKVIVIRAR